MATTKYWATHRVSTMFREATKNLILKLQLMTARCLGLKPYSGCSTLTRKRPKHWAVRCMAIQFSQPITMPRKSNSMASDRLATWIKLAGSAA
ncbi:Uncharacterised protein [Mycobacteroides abscessus subsp. abscessus]|nr:Uncharacterised protein [Mycobacteroides abscessus subsp. abscessus]